MAEGACPALCPRSHELAGTSSMNGHCARPCGPVGGSAGPPRCLLTSEEFCTALPGWTTEQQPGRAYTWRLATQARGRARGGCLHEGTQGFTHSVLSLRPLRAVVPSLAVGPAVAHRVLVGGGLLSCLTIATPSLHQGEACRRLRETPLLELTPQVQTRPELPGCDSNCGP